MGKKVKEKWEFGDFQTPDALALQVVRLLKKLNLRPCSVLEPTCGKGSFLMAVSKVYPDIQKLIGVEINDTYLQEARQRIAEAGMKKRTTLILSDFFTMDWTKVLESLPEPLLILGNPPWVTSTELAILRSKNLPEKSNFYGRRGYEAITGKSNFDISEWMLLKHLGWLMERRGIIAMLCKTSVARKVLFQAWKRSYPVSSARCFSIDARKHFNVFVDACFLVLEMMGDELSDNCLVYESIYATNPSYSIGLHDGFVIANVELYKKWKHLRGSDGVYIWRSGIKHDCAKVMELEKVGDSFRNGYGIIVSLEDAYIYPMLKSSDVGNGKVRAIRKFMLVPQKHVGDDTSHIKITAPKTWRYLNENAVALKKRASAIYRNRPPFSIFGVGDYSFSPWKVAISGFYKKLEFKVIGPVEGRPVVFDDTVYFLSCWSEEEANFVACLLNSKPAKEFFKSMIFWMDKRPVTIDILKRLNMHTLSIELGKELEYLKFIRRRSDCGKETVSGQLSIVFVEKPY